MDAVNAFNQEVRGARGKSAAGQPGRFSHCPRALEHRVGAGTLPALGSGAAGLELGRGRGHRLGLTPRPSPASAPFSPFRPVPAPASSTWPLCSRPVYRFCGARIPPGAATVRGRTDGRTRAGVPAGRGAGVAAASALLLLRPRRVGRWTLIPAGGELERVSALPPPELTRSQTQRGSFLAFLSRTYPFCTS